jgi:hypothetical protein
MEVPAHRKRRGAGHAEALVADQDGGVAVGRHDEDRLLEAGIEAGQVGQVGAVLTVGVDNQPIPAARLGTLAKAGQSVGVQARRQLGHVVGHPELREVDVGKASPHRHRRSIHRSLPGVQ